jgi:predicted AlkP superfamily pyrophosphatase or phosphodiesterase
VRLHEARPLGVRRVAARRAVGRRGALVPLLGLVLAVGCVPGATFTAARATPSPPLEPRAVVLVSIDGLRPDALEEAGARTLLRLASRGAASFEARTVLPSITLPSHTSMVTGVPPDVHGIHWNDDRTAEFGRVAVPTIFDLAAAHGLRTAAFLGKSKLRHLIGDAAPAVAHAPRGDHVLLAGRIVDEVEHYLRFARPHLLFVHIPDPDLMGHMFGWMRAPYRVAVRQADAAVARIIAAADRAYGACGYTLLVTSDHGGHSRGHGSGDPRDVLIPWIVMGPTVLPGTITTPIRTEDTAATVLALLGVPAPDAWVGRPVPAAQPVRTASAAAFSGCAAP